MGVRIYGYILSSIVSLVAYVGPYFPYALIGIAIAIGTSFVITYILVKKTGTSESQNVSALKKIS
jgi:PTS system beta-glucosides-specific IIC component